MDCDPDQLGLRAQPPLLRLAVLVVDPLGLLGDVLAGQNLAAKAVEEYKAVLEATEYDGDVDYPRTQLAAAERCVTLLQSLGRSEEAKSASAIATKLRSAL